MIGQTSTAATTVAAIPRGAVKADESGMRVLVIEDDREAADYLAKGLRESGYTVDHAADGKDGLFLALSEPYDVMIVDRMLPGPDGLTIVDSVRKSGIGTPVLFLSALGEVEDRVAGLKAGGATAPGENTYFKVGDLELDLLARKVLRQGKRVYLHPREFRLLEYLMRHAGQVVTRTMLLENVWEYHFDPQTNVIDVHISRLRQKIDKPFSKPILHTIRGAGYKLDPVA
jgi:two-component system OmpR family response regulator